MNYRSVDDETLLRLIAHARVEALSELYDRYHRLVYSLALTVVGDAGRAEEITLDIFLQVWEKAGLYRADHAEVSTWLTNMTRHRAIDILRQRNARPDARSTRWEETPLSAYVGSHDPEQVAEMAHVQQEVASAIRQLPAEQRRILALAYFHGYSHSEIAEMVNLPLGTVKSRVQLAVQKLRDLLGDRFRTREIR